jgi:homoserine O-acetyltransferase
MGGMAVLEWPLCTPSNYIRNIIPIATSARHSAWCISWSEAQRQSIYSDPCYLDGYYTADKQPKNGLSAARMAALLTYRSRDSFESRFGRRPQVISSSRGGGGGGGSSFVQDENQKGTPLTPPGSPSIGSIKALAAHNEGNRNSNTTLSAVGSLSTNGKTQKVNGVGTNAQNKATTTTTVFSAQSYLRYQGDKFTARFDANCYIHITRKMDTHDVSRARLLPGEEAEPSKALTRVLSTLPKGALVIGVESDGLFTPNEQRELAAHIPEAELVMIHSKDGHDGFLLEFEELNRCAYTLHVLIASFLMDVCRRILGFLRRELPELYVEDVQIDKEQSESFGVTRTSTFGEAEVDVALW